MNGWRLKTKGVLFIIICVLSPAYSDELPVPNLPPDMQAKAVMPADRLGEPWWKNRHQAACANVQNNQRLILIGDSITQFWEREGRDVYNALNQKNNGKVTNLGFSGDRTQHVIWRLKNGEFPKGINPEYAAILIGTNNAASENVASIAAGIAEIINIIHDTSPDTKILLLSILPRGQGTNDGLTKSCFNVNNIIKNYDGLLNVTYVDLTAQYLNKDGSLKDYLFTDRLHLSARGYELWSEKISELIGEQNEPVSGS
jgi:lysophospholipase L1-like esterase